jgi:hypothetical protein
MNPTSTSNSNPTAAAPPASKPGQKDPFADLADLF